MDIVNELRAAITAYDEWPTPERRVEVIDLCRRFIHAVDQRAAVIEQMRQHVSPSEQALSELLPELYGDG